MESRVTVEDLRSLRRSRGIPPRGRNADLLEHCCVHGVDMLRAPRVAADASASRVPPPSLLEAFIETPEMAIGARGVSGGGVNGGGEVLTVISSSQSLSVTCGTT